jgi:hypothetical protein
MIEGKRNSASLIIIGKLSIANAMRIHLPIYIVALAISMLILDPLISINTKLLIGIASPRSIASTHRSVYGGFLCAGSGIRSAEREPLAHFTNKNHTRQRDNNKASSITISFSLS